MKESELLLRIRRLYLSITEQPVLTSFVVLLLITTVVLSLSASYYLSDFEEFYMQVLVEAHGMIFDIAVIGILILWLNKNGEKRLRIKTYKDEIDDFRLWKSEEAAFRTVGNIKRLNGHHITNINLVNCYLSRTNLNYCCLKGSNINSADISSAQLLECDMSHARLNQTNFEGATLNQAVLYSAYANGAVFKDAFLIKTILEKTYLIKADFRNAFLMEADLRQAYLSGADFEGANLFKADLRGAVGLTAEQLLSVKSLEHARIDAEVYDQYVMLKEVKPAP